MIKLRGMNAGKTFSVFMVLVLLLFSFSTTSSAHAYIKKSVPAENEALSAAPKQVTIQFNEPIQASFYSIKVLNSEGKQVDQNNGSINADDPSILECDLNNPLPEGIYHVEWKAVSSDGHPIQGVIPFQIGSPTVSDGSSSLEEAGSTGYKPDFDLVVIRWIQYVSNALLVGILFFYLVIVPREGVQDKLVPIKKKFTVIITCSFLFLALSIGLSLPLQVKIESGLPWSQVLRGRQAVEDTLIGTIFGKAWLSAVVLLIILFLVGVLHRAKQWSQPIWLWLAFVIAIDLLLTKSLIGHAASSTNKMITVGMDFLHLLSSSIWIGCLAAFVSLLSLLRIPETKELFMLLVRRFAKWGILLVVVLAVTGVFGSWLYIPNFSSLLHTDYGRTLLGKIVLLILMVLFAGINFFKGKSGGEKGMAFSLWGEWSTGLIVLILSVILTNLPTAMAAPGPFKETHKVQGNEMTFEATPNTIGNNSYRVLLRNKNGQPLKDIEQITLTFSSLEMDMGEDHLTMTKAGEGNYKGKGFNFSMSGKWNVHVHVLTKALETLDSDFECLVGSQ